MASISEALGWSSTLERQRRTNRKTDREDSGNKQTQAAIKYNGKAGGLQTEQTGNVQKKE